MEAGDPETAAAADAEQADVELAAEARPEPASAWGRFRRMLG